MELKLLLKEVCDRVAVENGGNINWTRVAIAIGKEYGIVKTQNAWRKAYKRYFGVAYGLDVEVKEVKDVKELASLEMLRDGTVISERKIKMSETDMKNPDFVLEAHGFDPIEFELLSVKNNFWTGYSKDDGEIINYQSKITVKPRVESNQLSREDIDLFIQDIKPLPDGFRLVECQEDTEKFALEIDLFDSHLGSLSWGKEVGEDNDHKITFAQFEKIVSQARDIIMTQNIEKIYLIFGGDFLHIDTEGMTTTKGTKVDFDSRPKMMLDNAYLIVQYVIENLAMCPTEVIWVEGNHSRLLEYAIFRAMPMIYAHAKHIKFDVSPKSRKAFVYGNNLIGIHHGDMNKANQHGWLQNEYRKEWGESTYAETHSGHIHHERVVEKNGIINRSNPSSKPLDRYEYQEGYVSNKATLCFVWSKDSALKSIHYLR